MEVFDEIHVISDLHLGGPTGRQSFTGTSLLTGFIDKLCEPAEEPRRIALVINGDFVDFLAEPDACLFDVAEANRKLDRIFKEDESFSPIREALSRFVVTAGQTLVIVLGNHDLELAAPSVQQHFAELVGADPASRHRIRWSTTGEGFSASVCDQTVLCLHGNEVDPFNVMDYETLAQRIRDVEHGASPESWVPNAGTQLVIEVMNGIKQRLPFVDLLKPETDAVLPLLAALGEVTQARIDRMSDVALRVGVDSIRMKLGLLSDEDGAAETDVTSSSSLLSADFAAMVTRETDWKTVSPEEAARYLIFATEQRFRQGTDPWRLASPQQETLGLWNLSKAGVRWLWSHFSSRSPTEQLRFALQYLLRDRSFDLAYRDDAFKRIDKLVDSNADIVVAGHTHLERVLTRRSGGKYFNTGTWARLMRMDSKILESASDFEVYYHALKASSMTKLEPFVTHRPTVVSIADRGGRVIAELQRVRRDSRRNIVLTAPEIETKEVGA